jgi:N-acetyl-gamma-glutamyl-phosphate reductase
MIRAAIVGGTGYGGMELLRLLLAHPGVEIGAITSRTRTGAVVDSLPHLRGLTDLAFTTGRATDLAVENDVLFFATPHGVCAKEAADVLAVNDRVAVIDLSGDHRLDSADAYLQHYGKEHPHPEQMGAAVYGAPECGAREALRGARLVANPGCHAYASLIALWPLYRDGFVTGRSSVCSVTGSSGSGATASAGTHHPERFGNFKAYKPLQHQHVPEILLALDAAADGSPAVVDFVPHSAPFARGIHVTALVPVAPGGEVDAVHAVAAAYEREPFVRVLTDRTPEVRAVAGSNFVDVAANAGEGVVCVTTAIDNLGKGMAGTAVQNMNLSCGLEETAGLLAPGVGL